MASVNKVILVGNLGQDPEVRYTQGGQCVATLNIATNEKWTNKQSGQPEERTEWHRVVVWGKLAELCRDYLAKGRSAYIEGKLQTRKWEDKQGQARYTTEVVAQTIQFLGGGAGAGAGAGAGGGAPRGRGEAGAPMSSGGGADEPPPFEDDVPF